MADIFNKNKRSEIMSSVRSKKNKSTELRLIKIFSDINVKGWRRNYRIKGKPDFVFLKKKIAVFADGCFWHGHGCRNITPDNNKDYWKNKITTNRNRDKNITKHLQLIGWIVVRIWECELTIKSQHIAIRKIKKSLNAKNGNI